MLKEFVNKMIEFKRYDDLLELMSGDSNYCLDNPVNLPITKSDIELHLMSIHHVRFLKKFGHTDQVVFDEEGKVYQWYIDYFDKWLDSGVKGLEVVEVENYLKDHPFPTI